MIIDFHAHYPLGKNLGGVTRADEMLRAMDMAGVDKACVNNIFHSRASKANDCMAEFVRAHPDRFIGILYVTPIYPEEIEVEMARAVDELGMRGIKIYPPYYSRTIEDPVWEPVFAFAHARKLSILSHTDGDNPMVNPNNGEPQMFVRWAEKYPDANFVMGHSGNVAAGRQSCINAAKRCPNIYTEICSSWREINSIEELVTGVGEDRVLFGSDIPLMDPRIQMGRVITADISETAKKKILGENAARLLHL